MSTAAATLDAETALVAASRQRVGARLSGRERLSYGAGALLVVVCAGLMLLHDPPSAHQSWPLALALVASLAVASRIELEAGSGFASPVELVFIPMLFALPASQVPAAVALGLVAAHVAGDLRGGAAFGRVVVAVGNASYTLAPALLFMLLLERDAGPGRRAALAAAAVALQFAGDAVLSTLREHFAVGVSPRALVEPLTWTFSIDACLAPVGFAAALAGAAWAPAYLLPLALLALIRLFARERADRLTQALELSAA